MLALKAARAEARKKNQSGAALTDKQLKAGLNELNASRALYLRGDAHVCQSSSVNVEKRFFIVGISKKSRWEYDSFNFFARAAQYESHPP